MAEINLDTATSKEIHQKIEELMPDIRLTKYKKYIDNEVKGCLMIVCGIIIYLDVDRTR